MDSDTKMTWLLLGIAAILLILSYFAGSFLCNGLKDHHDYCVRNPDAQLCQPVYD